MIFLVFIEKTPFTVIIPTIISCAVWSCCVGMRFVARSSTCSLLGFRWGNLKFWWYSPDTDELNGSSLSPSVWEQRRQSLSGRTSGHTPGRTGCPCTCCTRKRCPGSCPAPHCWWWHRPGETSPCLWQSHSRYPQAWLLWALCPRRERQQHHGFSGNHPSKYYSSTLYVTIENWSFLPESLFKFQIQKHIQKAS